MAIEPALDMMQALVRTKPLKSCIQDWQNSADPTTGSDDTHEDGRVLANCDAFDLGGSQLCLLRMIFNPATHARTDAVANAAFASLLGLHREELLSRIAGHDLLLFFTDDNAQK